MPSIPIIMPQLGESIAEAIRAARDREVVSRLQSSAESIGQNRTAAAALDQQAAEQAIQQMIDALKERKDRELAVLRKRLQDAAEQVTRLIREQEAARDATREAGKLNAEAESYDRLASAQRDIRRNARHLGDELADMTRAAAAGQLVRQPGLLRCPDGQADAGADELLLLGRQVAAQFGLLLPQPLEQQRHDHRNGNDQQTLSQQGQKIIQHRGASCRNSGWNQSLAQIQPPALRPPDAERSFCICRPSFII
jgi:hypothetical protein